MEAITIRQIPTMGSEYRQLLEFRNRMLRLPLGQDLFREDLSDDNQNIILAAIREGAIVGCVMLQPAGEDTARLRQMAVAESLQGKGLGRILVENAEEAAVENGFIRITLHARLPARGFYEKLGYSAAGPVFTEVSIPHIAMHKSLV